MTDRERESNEKIGKKKMKEGRKQGRKKEKVIGTGGKESNERNQSQIIGGKGTREIHDKTLITQ